MDKIKNIIFKVLKIIGYLWIIVFSIAMFSLSFTDGQYHLGERILLLVIMNIVPVIFLIWRFKADKEIRLQKQKNKLEKKKEELQVRKELEEIEKYEENEKKNIEDIKIESQKDVVEELKKYKELLDDGIINQEEFYDKKKELLNKDKNDIAYQELKIKDNNSKLLSSVVITIFSLISLYFFFKAIAIFSLL